MYNSDKKSRNEIIIFSLIAGICIFICAILLYKLSSSTKFAAIKPPPKQEASVAPGDQPEEPLFDRLFNRLTAEARSKVDAIKQRPESQSALGMVDIVNGDSNAAIEKVSNAIAAKPDRAELYLQRSVAYITNGMILEGAQDIETAASLNYRYKPLALKCRVLVGTLEKSGIDKLLAAHDYSNGQGINNNQDINKIVKQLKESLNQSQQTGR